MHKSPGRHATFPPAPGPASRLVSRCASIALLCLLLAFPALSVKGAAGGLLLWFNVVLPTLSPFIICSQMVVALGGAELLTRPFFPAVHALFGLSRPGTYVLLCGLLCGYPLGAKMCGDFLARGEITRAEAQYLLSICNHPSPMFLLGFVGARLQGALTPAFLLACLYLPVLPVSLLSRRFYRITAWKKRSRKAMSICRIQQVPQSQQTLQYRQTSQPPTIEDVLLSTAETMVIIGGYIMLFSILAVWIQQLPFLPPGLAACLAGIAEITTGVNQLCTVLPPDYAALPVVATVAFGGFSGIFQTKSVIKNAGLSIRHYLFWKIIHTVCSCLTLLSAAALR